MLLATRHNMAASAQALLILGKYLAILMVQAPTRKDHLHSGLRRTTRGFRARTWRRSVFSNLMTSDVNSASVLVVQNWSRGRIDKLPEIVAAQKVEKVRPIHRFLKSFLSSPSHKQRPPPQKTRAVLLLGRTPGAPLLWTL